MTTSILKFYSPQPLLDPALIYSHWSPQDHSPSYSISLNGVDHMFRFKELYDKLREMKTEIEHVQHLLQKSKVQIQRDFEEWWKQHSTNRKLSPRAAWHMPPLPLRPGSQGQHGSRRERSHQVGVALVCTRRPLQPRWLTSSIQVVTREAAAAVEDGPHLC